MQDINNAIMQLLQTQQKMRAVEDNRVRNQMRARIVAQFRKDVQQFLTVNQEVFSIVDDPKERCAALTDQVRNGVIDAYAARDLVNSLSVSDSNLWNWDADRFLASGAPPDAASFVRSMNSCAAGSFRLLLKDDYELCKREYHAALLHSVVIGGQIPDDMGVIPEEMRGDAERVLRLKSIAERTMPCVVVCGLLKAGKSSLLNSLMDRDGCFAEGITRKTTRNQEETWNGMLVIDTPGIDANRQDTEEAMKAYRDADLLLFVHSADSELTRQDMDLLGSLRDEHGDLAGRLIAVLANRDIPRAKIFSWLLRIRCAGRSVCCKRVSPCSPSAAGATAARTPSCGQDPASMNCGTISWHGKPMALPKCVRRGKKPRMMHIRI